jgi:hypothetical protein
VKYRYLTDVPRIRSGDQENRGLLDLVAEPRGTCIMLGVSRVFNPLVAVGTPPYSLPTHQTSKKARHAFVASNS